MNPNFAKSKDPLMILNTVFNHTSFRSRQKEIIDNVLAGRNTLAILPTGAGKSICFQIPALIFEGLTVVVSPLIALMKDQVDNLRKKGIIEVAYINSSLDSATKERTFKYLKESKLKMLYVAPEALLDDKLMGILKSSNLNLIAIDEVHCISIWGHNFRPDYLRLKKVIHELNNPPTLGLTATATKKVEEDVQEQLGIRCDVFKDSPERKNLFFVVLTLKDNIKKEEFVEGLLGRLKGSKIVYVNFTKTAEELAGYLSKVGFSTAFYHGKMEKDDRKRIQNHFMSGKTEIVIATNAFGMGIDKEDIRAVIHFNLPKSIEDYYQEVGRAGRDGNISYCILLYSDRDAIKLRKLIKYNTPSLKKIKQFINFMLENREKKILLINERQLARDLRHSEVPIRLMLYYLEKEEAIKRHPKIFRLAKVRMLHEPLELEEETDRVLRDGYFSEERWVDLENLSEELGIPISKINRILRAMATAGRIELTEKDVRIPVEISPPLKDFNVDGLRHIFESLEQNSLRKIDKVNEYVYSVECRRKFILNYFGVRYDHPCNACDVCSPFLKLGEGLKASEIELVDKEAVEYLNGIIICKEDSANIAVLKTCLLFDGIAYSSLISGLLGYNHSPVKREEFNKLGMPGILKGKISKNELQELINGLVTEGLLVKTIDTEMFITKKGLDEIKKSVSPQDIASVHAVHGKEVNSQRDLSQSTEIAFAIFDLLKKLDFPPSRTLLRRILVGSKSKRVIGKNLNEQPLYGILKDYTSAEVMDIFDQLIEGNYLGKIKTQASSYPSLTLTSKAERALKKREQIDLRLPIKGNSIKNERNVLFEILKEWRREIALQQNISPYCVLHDRTLISIANQLPKTSEELGEIKGLGSRKIESYGDDLLDIVRLYPNYPDEILQLSKKGDKKHSEPWILGESKDPHVIPKLIEFTNSQNPNARRLAASALGKLSVFKPQIYVAVPHLTRLLEDNQPQVRQYAAKALGKIGSQNALKPLERLLTDEKPYVRESAKSAIRCIKMM